jgi:hypothetical protein
MTLQPALSGGIATAASRTRSRLPLVRLWAASNCLRADSRQGHSYRKKARAVPGPRPLSPARKSLVHRGWMRMRLKGQHPERPVEQCVPVAFSGNPVGGDRGLPSGTTFGSPHRDEPRSGGSPELREERRRPFSPSEFPPRAVQTTPQAQVLPSSVKPTGALERIESLRAPDTP